MIGRFFESLQRTRDRITKALGQVLSPGKRLNKEDLQKLEEILISADVGVKTTEKIISDMGNLLKTGELNGEDALRILKNFLVQTLGTPQPIAISFKPHVILIVGVNGTGKTTTIGKLAYRFANEGKKVLFAAADTFRAAASEQLEIWAKRTGVDIVSGQAGADPASVAFDTAQKAKSKSYDVLIIDTAGRLHTKKNLMEELRKIARVVGKAIEGAPHDTFLIIDATTGQNGLSQAEVFHEAIPLSGIIITKLDGTAKGGIAIAIRQKLDIPIRAVGIGEKLDDLFDFSPNDFVEGIIGE